MTVIINNRVFIFFSCTLLFAGCHSMVSMVNIHDSEMTCSEIDMEIIKMEALQQEIQDNCGMSSRNGIAIFFWPSIILNEVTGTLAQNRATDRIDHLKALSAQKCDENYSCSTT